MITSEQVLEDPHAPPEWRYRGYVVDSELALTDAAAPTHDEALARARRRWRLRWLGVECPGIVRLPGSESPEAGQIAFNGHRYALWRRLTESADERCICWIMLNPSTADHRSDDATLRRIRRYSLDAGFGWLTVGNLWSYRATAPGDLATWLDGNSLRREYSRDNDAYIHSMARRAERIVVAWGNAGAWFKRGDQMLDGLAPYPVCALALTQAGQPGHPLRLPRGFSPIPLDALRALHDADSARTTHAA